MKAEAADRRVRLELLHAAGSIAQSEIDEQRHADDLAFARAAKGEGAL